MLHPVQCGSALTEHLAVLPGDISHRQCYETICPWVWFVIPRVVRNRSLHMIQSPNHVWAYLKLKLKWYISQLRHQPLKSFILFFSSPCLWPVHLFLLQEWAETSLFFTWISVKWRKQKSCESIKKTCFSYKLHIRTEFWMSSRNQGAFHFNDVNWGIRVYLLGPTLDCLLSVLPQTSAHISTSHPWIMKSNWESPNTTLKKQTILSPFYKHSCLRKFPTGSKKLRHPTLP